MRYCGGVCMCVAVMWLWLQMTWGWIQSSCVRRLHTPRPHPRLIDPRAHDPSPVTSTTITTYREKKQIYTRIHHHHHHHHMANLPESLSHCKPSKHGDKTQPTLPTTSCHEPKTSPAPPPPPPFSNKMTRPKVPNPANRVKQQHVCTFSYDTRSRGRIKGKGAAEPSGIAPLIDNGPQQQHSALSVCPQPAGRPDDSFLFFFLFVLE